MRSGTLLAKLQLFIAVGLISASATPHALAQHLGLEPLVMGIDRPAHVVQAPGDPGSLYVIEQRAGRIINVNLASGTRSTVITFTGFDTTIEGGVHAMAFHPQFETNGLFYVGWLEDGGADIGDYGNVDEFQLVGGQGQFTKRILRHQIRDSAASHGLDWVGFDPTAAGDAQNYLYITTGDGGFDAMNLANDFSQDLSTLFGKVLRVDVRTDDFPADPDRHYAIPPGNPYAGDGDPNTRGEVFLSGLRNPWRMSFDRETGDIFIGDVGLGDREEVDFVKAGESGVDFGWNAFEGTIARGKPSLRPEPRLPIHEYTHDGGNVSVTGGYVYRGPIVDLRGEYFFADFNTSNVWSGDFDRETSPATFNGANLSMTQRTAELNQGIVGGEPPGHIVSFGEDLEGNLLLVDYGQGNPVNPLPNTGAIYKLIEVEELIPGDFNDDGTVDAADYVVWREGLGTTYTQNDYDAWRANFGKTHSSGAGPPSTEPRSAAVPEPPSMLIYLLALVVTRLRRHVTVL